MLCIAVQSQEYGFCAVCPRGKVWVSPLEIRSVTDPLFCTANDVLLSEPLKEKATL